MCKPDFKKTDGDAPEEVDISLLKKNEVVPTHSAGKRDTRYDLLYFLAPALFSTITDVVPIYITAIGRMLAADIVLSLHYQFVDKDNYLNKLSQKQLERERDDYRTAFYLHMWIQVALQLIFPTMFFSDNSELWTCAKEALICHILIVEPLYYVVHRWLHIPKQMKAMHGFHHLSIKTTPTTALVQNFHEHFVYVATFGPAFFVPFLLKGRQHWAVIGAYLVLFDVINSFGHTNIRIRNWLFNSVYSPITYLFYTPEFHLGHHAYFYANYGLFMPIWDRMFGTYREYRKKDIELLPSDKQDFVFIGHNGGLGHFFTIPEISLYNMYDEYMRTWLPIKLEMMIMHGIGMMARLVTKFYYCSRYCIGNEKIGRIICLSRTPWDYMTPSSYKTVNQEMIDLMRKEFDRCGTRYYGLGNLNKMKQLNDGGIELAKMVKEDPYLKDKNIRVWTGDTMTVASLYNQMLEIPDLQEFYYVGAGGKLGTAVCEMLCKAKPNLKIRIFSRNQVLNHPNISYSTDLSEIKNYEVALVGKILSAKMYKKAFSGEGACKTRFILDYTVPFLPLDDVLEGRKEKIQHVRIGLLKTTAKNVFLKGHYDVCMGHDENHIVPCHFGCILNSERQRESDEVGEINQKDVERLWKMAVARGFGNVHVDFYQ